MVVKQSPRFELINPIYEGEYGKARIAFDRATGKTVHIIVLPVSQEQAKSAHDKLEQEVHKIQSLDHPRILPIQEVILDGDRVYIVSKFFEGETLDERLNYRPFELDEAIQVVRQIGEALEALHATGIIHGDLKPAHIILDNAGNAFLTGLGIYQHVLTAVGNSPKILVGPLGYISPEQAEGKTPLDGRSDLYSLSVIFYRMLTGRLPFEESSPLGIAVQHASRPNPTIEQKSIPRRIKKSLQVN